MTSWSVFPEKTPSTQVQALAAQVERDGGHVLALYQDPVGDHWQIFCLLPHERVQASPYQRDLSPTHVKRLTDKLRAAWVPAILVVERETAFQVLALNTEKAHNLKEKSLEVIRMYRALSEDKPGSSEEEWAFQFEAAHFITLGLLYEGNKRFAGGAFAPILRRVDKFLKLTLARGLREREARAALVRETDETLAVTVAKVKKRGINHPYVKNYLLARTTPLTRARKTLPSFEQTFKKLRENLAAFDVSKVRYDEIQRSAIMAMPATNE